jgi:hypothetical protein
MRRSACASSGRQHQRQRELAFAQIGQQRLAGLLARVIEHVVDQLKGDTEPLTKAAEALLIRRACARDACADARRPAEKRRGLVAQDALVRSLGHVELAPATQLNDFAFDQASQGSDQVRHHLGRVLRGAIE